MHFYLRLGLIKNANKRRASLGEKHVGENIKLNKNIIKFVLKLDFRITPLDMI